MQNVYKNFVNMWDTFWIHFLYINFDLQKVYIINIMYTICIQNLYRMYTKINACRMNSSFQHILTCLFRKQLRHETCWLIKRGTYQINGLLDYILH